MPRRKIDKSESERIARVLSSRLRGFRTRRAWTQEMAAERVGLSTEAYARLERGHSLPSYPTLARICEQMGTTPNVLLGYPACDEDEAPPAEPASDARPAAAQTPSEHDLTVRRIASQLRDLDTALVDAVARLVAILWRSR